MAKYIYIDADIYLKSGVSVEAVADRLKTFYRNVCIADDADQPCRLIQISHHSRDDFDEMKNIRFLNKIAMYIKECTINVTVEEVRSIGAPKQARWRYILNDGRFIREIERITWEKTEIHHYRYWTWGSLFLKESPDTPAEDIVNALRDVLEDACFDREKMSVTFSDEGTGQKENAVCLILDEYLPSIRNGSVNFERIDQIAGPQSHCSWRYIYTGSGFVRQDIQSSWI